MPKTSSGKIRRAACRDLHREGNLTRPRRHPRLALVRLTLRSWVPRARDVRHAVVGLAYAAYAWSVMVALAGPAAMTLFIVPRRSWRLAVVRRGLGLLARLTRTPVTVSGREHLAALDGAVVVANHPSWIDGAVLAAILPGAPVFVVAGELAHHLWSGPLLRRIGVEFVERATHERGAEDTRRLIAATRSGTDARGLPRRSALARSRTARLPARRVPRRGRGSRSRSSRCPFAARGRCSSRAGRFLATERCSSTWASRSAPISPVGTGRWSSSKRHARQVLARCGEPDIA